MFMNLERCILLILVAFCFSENAFSGSKNQEIEAAVDAAINDWEPTLTCGVLEPEGFKIKIDLWNEDRSQISTAMLAAGIDKAFVNRMLEKTEPENVMQKTKGTAKELIDYCNNHPDWMLIWTQFDNVLLRTRVKNILEQK